MTDRPARSLPYRAGMVRRHPWLVLFAVRIAVAVAALALVDALVPGAGFVVSVVVALAASALVSALVEKRLGIDAASRRAAAERGDAGGGAPGGHVGPRDGGSRDGTPPPGGPDGGAGGR